MIRAWIGFALAAAIAYAAGDADGVQRAMRDELARSMAKLQLENLQKPYFISYRLVDRDTVSSAASFGAIVERKQNRSRLLAVEVRVGSYERDNTNFFALRGGAGVIRIDVNGGLTISIDDNYDELRRQLWLATDAAYKQALDDFSRKKAALEHRNRTDDAPDFSHEPVVTDSEMPARAEMTATAMEALSKPLSALFRQAAGIQNSQVKIDATNVLTRFVTSEGTEFTRLTPLITLSASGEAQAADGMPISDSLNLYVRSASAMPSKDDLTRQVQDLIARIQKLQVAPLVERYNGPVLFEGDAAAELVAQTLAPSLTGQPRVVVDDTRFEALVGDDGSLKDKIGNRILPAWVKLTDDPARASFGGRPLLGGSQVDEDGVKTRTTVLVDNGVLKSILHTRALVAGTTQSSGSRRPIGPSPSNLILESTGGLPAAELKAKLIAIVKQRGLEFGILVRKIGNPSSQLVRSRSRMIIRVGGGGSDAPVEPVVEAYKVYADGREELIRNIGVMGMNVANFRDIVAVSDKPVVYSAPYRNPKPSPIGRGPISAFAAMMSVVTPSLLFDDMTMQRPAGEIPKLPFAKHPYFDK